MIETATIHEFPPPASKPRLRTRFARNDEAERIKHLVTNGGFPVEMADSLNWERVSNYWIVVDDCKQAIGCLQVVMAFPIGRLEYLGYDENLTHPQRARVVKMLLNKGCRMQADAGVAMVSGTVPFEFKGYKRALKKRGGVMTAQGNVFVKRTL